MHPSVQTMSALPPQPGRSIWIIFPTTNWSHLPVVGGLGGTSVVVVVVVVVVSSDPSHFGLWLVVLSEPPSLQE